MKEQFQQLIAAWARGDVTALEELADDELKANPNVRKVLLTSRNARWADWIAKRMDTPGTVFVAVGAGHLAGDDSVQHMRSEEHTSELQSLMRISYAVFCLKKKKTNINKNRNNRSTILDTAL